MLNKTTKLLMMLAVLVLTAGIIPPPPSGNVAWSKKPKDPGQGTSGLFVRADFQTAITETGTGEPAEPADMLSDLEGSVVAPVVMSPCRGPYDFWDSRFDTVCTDLSSGSVSSSVSSGGRWQMFTRIGGDTSTLTNNRWFVFNFTVSPDGDPCPNLDSLLYSGPAGDLFQPPINTDSCVDNLEVRLRAGVLFKGNTTEQALDIQILGQQAPIYNLI